MAKILFFGRLSDVSPNLDVDLPDGVVSTADLVEWLGETNETLGRELAKPSNRIAVNKTIITKPVAISNADEVAFMSPLSGG